MRKESVQTECSLYGKHKHLRHYETKTE